MRSKKLALFHNTKELILYDNPLLSNNESLDFANEVEKVCYRY